MGFADAIDRQDYRARQSTLRTSERGKAVYAVGLDARPVTIFSQQVRALRLADSLAASHQYAGAHRVGVIGGGVAGMTFAYAYKCLLPDAEVEVLDDRRRPFGRFRTSPRYVHPRLYDWPAPGWQNGRAGLPLFAWTAGPAKTVVAEWEQELKLLRREVGDLFDPDCNQTIETVLPPSAGRTEARVVGADGLERDYHLVVLATGFGIDNEKQPSIPKTNKLNKRLASIKGNYWKLDPTELRTTSMYPNIVVVGGGDGAIIDALGLVLQDDYQKAIVESGLQPGNSAEQAQLQASLHATRTNKIEAPYLFGELDNILPQVDGQAPRVFICTGQNASRSATPLNRLLLAYALERGLIVEEDDPEQDVSKKDFAGLSPTILSYPVQRDSKKRNGILWRTGPQVSAPSIQNAYPTSVKLPDIESLRHFRRVEEYEVSQSG